MKPRFFGTAWWLGTLVMLLLSNAILAYWILVEIVGFENGYWFGDFIFHLVMFPGMFLAPVAAILGFLCSVDHLRLGERVKAAVLAFLTGGAALTAYVSWYAIFGPRP